MVHNERIDELLPLEERIRRLGGERSYAAGIAIGETLLQIARAVSSRLPRHGVKSGPSSLGGHVAAGD